jgi:membrane-associated protease RseP (regulator of RpoE activity)
MNPLGPLIGLLQNGWTIIEVVLFFSFLIFVHELGHFIAAKMTGMKVEEFAIGFGKHVFSFKKGETTYALNWILFGGYNKIYGMDLEEEEANKLISSESAGEEKKEGPDFESKAKEALSQDYSIAPRDDPRAFANRPLGQRFIVLAAGSIANILTAVIVIFLMGISIGFPAAELGQIIKNGPADQAGLLAGDIINRLDGIPISSTDDLRAAVAGSNGKPINLTGIRGSEPLKATLIPLPIRMVDSHLCRLGFVYLNDGTLYYSIPGTPAGRSDLKRGDMIISVDGLQFPSHSLDISSGNGITRIEVFRGLAALTVDVDHFDNEFVQDAYSPFGFLYNKDNLISSVIPDSIAATAGLMAGDKIVESSQNMWTAPEGEPEGSSRALAVTYERNGATHKTRMEPDESFSRIQVFMDNASYPIISNLQYNHRLYMAGLRSGDRVLSVGGTDTKNGISAFLAFERMLGQTVSVVAMVKGQERVFNVRVPGETDVAGAREFLGGLHFTTRYYRIDPVTSFITGVRKTSDVVALIFKTLAYLISGKIGAVALTGPVGIATFTYDAAKSGLADLINLMVLLTINLGVFNLLPFPALDGGRLIFIIAEGIFRRPVLTVRVENWIHAVGFLIIILFTIFVAYHDIARQFFSN